jgi:hypothetical protein
MTLLDEVVSAYGGRDRWERLTSITIHQNIGGTLWARKGVEGILEGATVEIEPGHQRTWHRPLPTAGFRSSYSPELVRIETDDDAATVIEELPSPRESFAGHTAVSPRTTLQLAYFAGFAMWTYLSEPYSLTLPGVHTEELGPWREDGHTWRRLGIRFPDSIATQSAEQTVYIDADGLIQRRDYTAELLGSSLTAHYSAGHQEFDGIVVATRRAAYRRGTDNAIVSGSEPLVTIDIDNVVVK